MHHIREGMNRLRTMRAEACIDEDDDDAEVGEHSVHLEAHAVIRHHSHALSRCEESLLERIDRITVQMHSKSSCNGVMIEQQPRLVQRYQMIEPSIWRLGFAASEPGVCQSVASVSKKNR